MLNALTRQDSKTISVNDSALFANQIIPPVQSNAPNLAELKARIKVMSSIKGANINDNDTEQEALNKLASIGITGESVPLSANQRLAADYQIAAMAEKEHELVQTYIRRNDPNLARLLNAYVVESKLREKASVTQHPYQAGSLISEHPEVFRIITNRIQHNTALTIEAGGRLTIYNREPTQQERDAMQTHLLKAVGNHPDSRVLSHSSDLGANL